MRGVAMVTCSFKYYYRSKGGVSIAGYVGDDLRQIVDKALVFVELNEAWFDKVAGHKRKLHHIPMWELHTELFIQPLQVGHDNTSLDVAVTTAMASDLWDLDTNKAIAATGELDLFGRMGFVKGVIIKAMACKEKGLQALLIPWRSIVEKEKCCSPNPFLNYNMSLWEVEGEAKLIKAWFFEQAFAAMTKLSHYRKGGECQPSIIAQAERNIVLNTLIRFTSWPFSRFFPPTPLPLVQCLLFLTLLCPHQAP